MTTVLRDRSGAPDYPSPEIPLLCNLDAERATLGAILINQEQYYAVSEIITAPDFFREAHRWIFEIYGDLIARRGVIDFTTVTDALDRRGQLAEIGGPGYLTALISDIPSFGGAIHYAEIVADFSARRAIVGAAGFLAEQAYSQADLPSIRNAIDRKLQELDRPDANRDVIPVARSVTSVMDRIAYLQENPDLLLGIPTGYAGLDRILGGMQKGDLVIVAGRPGMGKTMFGLNIVMNAARQFGTAAAVFTIEMSSDQLTQRLLAMESMIDLSRIAKAAILDSEQDRLVNAANNVFMLPIVIVDRPGITIAEIRSKARSIQRDQGLDLILVDYMQLIDSAGNDDNGDRQRAMAYISRSLKLLARELNVPVIAVSQLSRAVEQRANKRPILSDLRDSGGIEQDADIIMFLYSDDYYDKDSDKQNLVEIDVAKHRQGPTGTVTLYSQKQYMLFRNVDYGAGDPE